MRFADPIWLDIGAVATVIVALLLARAERLRTRALVRLAGSRRLLGGASVASPFRRWARVVVATVSVAMIFVALARPQKGTHWETVERKGTDLLLVVDTSRSMDADDVKPTRLERAKLAIRDLVEKFPGDRIGLVAFAGDAFVQSPMTLDHAALLETVDALDTSIIARGGTNIARAIEVATAALETEPGHQKALVLLSDGEELQGKGLAEAKKAAARGITIDTIGVGSVGGELVPSKDELGRPAGVVRDESGSPVRSQLDEEGLRAIAGAAQGAYRPLGADGRGLERLYDESLASRAQLEASSRTRRVYAERFGIPLGVGLFGIVLDALLGLPRRRRAKRTAVGGVAAAAAALVVILAPGRAHASVAQAQEAYASGDFERSHDLFVAESEKRPDDPRLSFNAGDAAYRAGRFDDADAAFRRALEKADPELQQRVLYNRGGALYRSGQTHEKDARDKTIASWKAAIEAYEGALALDPSDADARFNRDLVKRKLAELEQQPKEQEPKKQEQEQQQQQQQQQQQGQPQDGKEDAKEDKTSGPEPREGEGEGEKPEPDESNEGAEAGRLSEKQARALLDALKGEERSALRRGTDAGAPQDDPPRKDW